MVENLLRPTGRHRAATWGLILGARSTSGLCFTAGLAQFGRYHVKKLCQDEIPCLLKETKELGGGGAHTFSVSTQVAGAGGSLNSEVSLCTEKSCLTNTNIIIIITHNYNQHHQQQQNNAAEAMVTKSHKQPWNKKQSWALGSANLSPGLFFPGQH